MLTPTDLHLLRIMLWLSQHNSFSPPYHLTALLYKVKYILSTGYLVYLMYLGLHSSLGITPKYYITFCNILEIHTLRMVPFQLACFF